MRRLLLPLVVVSLWACNDAPTDTAGACEAAGLERAQSWDQQALTGVSEPLDEDGNAGVGLGDLDGDGWLDALVVSPRGSLALRNDGAGNLEIADWGVPEALGVALADVDNDGDLDAWLGTMPGLPDQLLINDGAANFTAVDLPGVDRGSYTGSFADLDGDGDLDLLVARHIDGELDPAALLDGSATGEGNALYRNDGGTLTLDESALPAEVADDVSFMGQWLDADADGDLDLYLVNDFGPLLGRNRLLRNDGGALSIDDGCACDLQAFSMGAGVGDADGDGRPDLFLSDIGGPDLLLSDGAGGFYEASKALGADVPYDPEHLAGWGTAFVDLDGDGWEDLPMVFGPVFSGADANWLGSLDPAYAGWEDNPDQRDVVLRGTGGGFEDVSADWGFDDPGRGRALATGDLDRDGRPELVTAGLWFVDVWRPTGGCGPGATLRPVGEGLVAGVGARIEAGLDGRTLTRWLHPESTWSSSALEVSLGAGGAAQLDAVRVIWADGRETELGSIAPGDVIDLSP